MCFEKHFISYSCIFISYIQCFEVCFQKFSFFFFFFKQGVFPDFQLVHCVFRSIEILVKNFSEPLSGSIDWTCFSINQTLWIKFFKNSVLTYSNIFSKLFKTFSLSLSDSARLYRDFFVVFLQNSCKVSLSLSLYVYFTLPFALFFSFSCIISWFLSNFRTMLNLGFLINQVLFYEFDQWVLFLQWCIHDIYWLIW